MIDNQPVGRIELATINARINNINARITNHEQLTLMRFDKLEATLNALKDRIENAEFHVNGLEG